MIALRLPFVAVLFSTLALAQGDFIVTVNTSDGDLRVIDPTTGVTLSATTMVAGATGVTQPTGLTFDSVTGTLFGIVRAGGPRSLATIDPLTGNTTIIGPMGDQFAGLAARADGVLFGVTGDGATTPEALFTIDKSTAASTFVMNLGNGIQGETIGFGNDGFLYHASGSGLANTTEVFERIDTSTNTITPVTLSGYDYDTMLSLVAIAGDNMLGIDGSDEIMVVNSSGVVTFLGRLDHGACKGLAVIPSRNSQAFFRTYGAGCAGTSGEIPLMLAAGTPSAGSNVFIRTLLAPASAFGLFAFGFGTTTAPLPSLTCQAQVLPVFATIGLITTTAGTHSIILNLPTNLLPGDFYMQTGILDGVSFVVSNPLHMHIM